ncbi:MAG: IS110 family transposase [Clostridia bacterium]|nr:IS110 family transposase [Clostridia bacterium]
MNAVGIDVSKGKSTVTVMQPFGVVIASPFEVEHTEKELEGLAKFLKSLVGETKVLMEYTGHYYEPIARYLHESGIFVSVVNAILAHDYTGNSVRRAKTDKKDAAKLANMAIDRWLDLKEYIPEDEIRQTLKICNRQYNQYNKLKTMLKNNLIALIDQTFPNANKLFSSPARKSDGHEKWVDFVLKFWHCECVCGISEKQFKDKYARWCKRNGYHYSDYKAEDIYIEACGNIGLLPMCESTKVLITQAIIQLQTIEEALAALKHEMNELSASLPEYNTVMSFYGVGEVLGAQLIAEIGDVSRFESKKSLIAFAGIDAPPYQSGTVNVQSRSISKRGSASLRKTLFQIMSVILQKSPYDDPVFTYLDKKRSEGKPYKVYMIAAANKFLRIYYARVKECLVNT